MWIQDYLDQASSYAGEMDSLFMLITWIVGAWFVAVEGLFFYFMIKFREKDGVKALYLEGTTKHETKWLNRSHVLILVCDVFLIIGAVRVWVLIKQTLPEPDAVVRITAQQWAWTFQHPGPDNELDTDDDITLVDELHLEVDKTYHFQLESRDVLHALSIPVFRLRQDIIPGRRIMGWFTPILTGEYDIQCAEMCGIGHGLMPAIVFVESAATHASFHAEYAPSVASNTAE
jgi:cytochrome c oxidase subunit 2